VDEIPLAYIHFPEEKPNHEESVRYFIKLGQEYALKLGYRLNFFDAREFESGIQATRILYSRGTQGILVPHGLDLNRLQGMDWARFSVVGWGSGAMNLDLPQPPLNRVAVDHFGAVVQAWNETCQRGYQKIGFALPTLLPSSTNDQSRWAAVQYCLQRVPSRLRLPTFFSGSRADVDQICPWARRYRPDAIIGFNTWMRHALESGGFRIPHDAGYVSLHKDFDIGPGHLRDRDSGMEQPEVECMRAAVELLDQQIRHHQCGFSEQTRTVMIHAKWVDGETLPSKVTKPSKTARFHAPRQLRVA
jgi:DNA-binding LacI/PurR family transcriptional regulator